jgi:hypothetical protein
VGAVAAPLPSGRGAKLRRAIGHGLPGACRLLDLLGVDLRQDGPHALVAGTTGAGKSELLQTMIASLAVVNRPDAMTFVLVDHKGGSAFKDCVHLPHVTGMVTDLDAHLTRRALASLSAELTRRETILAAAGVKDLEDYTERAGRQPRHQPLPRLVIVIDEFASLARDLPDFVAGLVGIAQRGRSLGLHLILATQRPSGAVSVGIRASTSLRIALRMTDAAESADVIDAPGTARISRAAPGRGYVRLGHASLIPFQAGRIGGRRPGRPDRPRPAQPVAGAAAAHAAAARPARPGQAAGARARAGPVRPHRPPWCAAAAARDAGPGILRAPDGGRRAAVRALAAAAHHRRLARGRLQLRRRPPVRPRLRQRRTAAAGRPPALRGGGRPHPGRARRPAARPAGRRTIPPARPARRRPLRRDHRTARRRPGQGTPAPRHGPAGPLGRVHHHPRRGRRRRPDRRDHPDPVRGRQRRHPPDHDRGPVPGLLPCRQDLVPGREDCLATAVDRFIL